MNLLKYRAIIDAGSGNIKLGIYKETSTHFALNYKLVAQRQEKLLLSAKIINETLSAEGEEELVNTVLEMIQICKIYGIEENRITILTTKWFKKIKDRELLLARLKRKTKIKNWIPLTGKKEAELAFKSVKATSLEEEGIVCDLAGNSIEMASFSDNEAQVKTRSLKLGYWYIKKYFSISSRPNRTQRNQITSFVIDSLEKNPTSWLGEGKDLILLSNIGRSIFALYNHFAGIDDDPSHAKSITYLQFENIIKETSRISYEKMMSITNFNLEEWDLIEICMSIIRGIMIVARSKFLVLSLTSIKEGYLAVQQEEVDL